MKENYNLTARKAFLTASVAAAMALTGAGLASASGPQNSNQAPFSPKAVQSQSSDWQNGQSQNGGSQNHNNDRQNNSSDHNQKSANHENDNHDQRNQGCGNQNDNNHRNKVIIYGRVESVAHGRLIVKSGNGGCDYTVSIFSAKLIGKNGKAINRGDINQGDHVSIQGQRISNSNAIQAKMIRDLDQS